MSDHPFGLTKSTLERIVAVIIARQGVERIVLFGSRAAGNYKPASDIDLAVFASRWTTRDANIVKAQMEEDIPVPFKFDLVHFETLEKEHLKKAILEGGKTIYESGKD